METEDQDLVNNNNAHAIQEEEGQKEAENADSEFVDMSEEGIEFCFRS